VRVEDVMPIATGHEREELEADLQVRRTVLLLRGSVDSVLENGFWFLDLVCVSQGKKRFDMDPIVSPFGTKVRWLMYIIHLLSVASLHSSERGFLLHVVCKMFVSAVGRTFANHSHVAT
jgi:hypothetical protein